MNQQLANYIQQQLNLGYNIEAIKSFLIKQGYNQKEVEEAANSIMQQKLAPLINYVKDGLSKGSDPDTIKSQLLAMGYQAPDINNALQDAQKKPGMQVSRLRIWASRAVPRNPVARTTTAQKPTSR